MPFAPEIAWVGPAVPVDSPPGGWRLTRYADADELLLSAAPFGHALYVLAIQNDGLAVDDLVVRLRRRTDACILVAHVQHDPERVMQALEAGADLWLPVPITWRLLQAAFQALQRRCSAAQPTRAWALHAVRHVLATPEGAQITLSEHERAVMHAFVEAAGQPVARELLAERLWGDSARAPSSNALHAVIYRLRRRVEDESGTAMPLRSVPGAGYEFNARLVQED
jgi:two-component system OmpR family response regulator